MATEDTASSSRSERNSPEDNNDTESRAYVRVVNHPMSLYKLRLRGDRKTSSCLYSESYVSGDRSVLVTAGGEVNNKYPRVEIVNAAGPGVLVITCVANNAPHHVHPHRLIGEKCKSGVCVIPISKDQRFVEMSGVNIEYTRKSDTETRLQELKLLQIDPFNAGYEIDPCLVDLTHIRLCFQVYLTTDSVTSHGLLRDSTSLHLLRTPGAVAGMRATLPPVVSNTIVNVIVRPRLQVTRAENLQSPVSGGKTIILFVRKLEKDQQKNLWAKFYDKHGWSRVVEVNENLIHYRSAVMFNAPKYKQMDTKNSVGVYLKLFVPFASERERDEHTKERENSNCKSSDEDDDDSDKMPDVKYQSKTLIFIYTPITNLSRPKLNLSSVFSFVDKESDASSEINPKSRLRLAKRAVELLYTEAGTNLRHGGGGDYSSPSTTQPVDSVSLNHILKYTGEATLNSLLPASDSDPTNSDCLLLLDQIRRILDSRYSTEFQSSNHHLVIDSGSPTSDVSFDKLFSF